jgi:hypothetical protein
LNKKGYTSNNDIPCGPNCYGVDYYVEINAALHDWEDGHQVPADEIRLTVHHLQSYTTPQGYDDAKEVGLYYSATGKISAWDDTNRARMIKMIERLPTCADLRLKERRNCITDGDGCFRGIGRSGE